MAGTSASLVVRISADINDFTRGLDAATRGVDRAAKKIESVGRALTIGITVPVVAATVALGKMAAENQDTGARIERVFGSAADSVNGSIKKMMASVPEANTELQQMAISVDNMAQGMGLAPAKAAAMSEALLRLSGDASAFAHVPIAEALDAFSRGLAGKTKGLLQFGIAISEADIKQRAYQLGLLHTGNELTETGTAQAAFSLIMERSTRIQGEAARTADQSGKSFTFLKRDLGELADNVSGLVLPALSGLANGGREVVAMLASLDPATVKTFFELAAGAAVIGPVIVIFVRLVDLVFKVRAAFALLSAGSGIAAFFGGLAALPFATIVAGVVAIAGAIGGLYLIWKKFRGEAEASPLPKLTIEHQAPNEDQLKKFFGGPAGSVGKDDASERLAGTPLEQFKKHADALTKGFDDAVAHGRPVESMLAKMNSLHAEAGRLLRSQGGAFNETAQAAQEVLDRVTQIRNAMTLAAATTPEAQQLVITRIARDQKTGFNAPQQAASDVAKETFDRSRDLELRLAKIQLPAFSAPKSEAVVQSLESSRAREQALALREELLKLPDGFNAAREAAVEFGESQRQYTEDLQKRLITSARPSTFDAKGEAQVKSNEAVKSFGDDIALRRALLKLPDGFDAAALAAVQYAEEQRSATETIALRYETLRLKLDQFGIHLGNVGERMQGFVLTLQAGLDQFLDGVISKIGGQGKNAQNGRGLGSFIGTGLGWLAGGPIGAYIGNKLGGAIGGQVGGMMDHAKSATDKVAESMGTLAKTVERVNSSITNVPAWFKVQSVRFEAAPVVTAPPVTSTTGSTGKSGNSGNNGGGEKPKEGDPTLILPGAGGGSGLSLSGTFNFYGVQDVKSLMEELSYTNLKRRATGSTAALAFASVP